MSEMPDGVDLADLVHDHMTKFASDNAMSGFIIHRSSEDGTAAVTFRPGAVAAYTYVLRKELSGWADRLRKHGFTAAIETRDDRGEKDVPQWLRITGWQQPDARRHISQPSGQEGPSA